MLHSHNIFPANEKITLTKATLVGVSLSLFLQFAEISFMAFRGFLVGLRWFFFYSQLEQHWFFFPVTLNR